MKRLIMTVAAVLALVSGAAADNLVLPAFAHNVSGLNGCRWSSEIYLTNPTDLPVQVTIAALLPGRVERPAPCDLFMPTIASNSNKCIWQFH